MNNFSADGRTYKTKMNMKKEYTKPQMEVVKIQMAQMLCVSKVNQVNSGGVFSGLGGGSNSSARGRESDDWDDEW